MQFFKTAVSLALAAFAAVASAQDLKGNAITAPTAGTVIEAGSTFDIKWINPVGEQVTLVIMDGDANSLKPIRTIITNLPNSGTYTWSVPEDLPTSGTYTIRISYDSTPANYNYSDRFVFTSDFVSTTSASASTTSAPTTSAPATTSTSAPTTSSNATTSESSESSTTINTSTTTRRTTTSESTGEPTSLGAPPSAGTTTLSSPLAVIMAVLAAAIFIH
ncbi:uncharacterized protein DFL_007143 [Arthrobotrys flagrans]|uniref:Yeast cell wall synthesis Kre9/Knh1-like N-terminal domain-containing protein n=1 Tax=Arthrobotrys flagrans TaxID=97331 RepID=A0A436ZUV9_ARTFL|nr:hypothetical protein DFL_007143 [Arthrobotrys flagrans]